MTNPPSHRGFVTLDREELLGALIRMALAEDVGSGDWTSTWTIPEAARGEASIVAKQKVVVAGMAVASRVFHAVDPDLDIRVRRGDGNSADKGQELVEIRGSLRSILTAERTALNFLGHLSGIATLTRAFVDAVEGTRARIVDTRKTTPGWRYLEKDAVRAGGGMNHRMGLFDMVLIKDNHIAACGGITAALQAVERNNRPELPVELEVSSLQELGEALRNPPDRILLDNMSIREMTEAVQRVSNLGSSRPELEASGNVRLDTVRAIAQTGVDLISVGALTHSAPVADLSLQVRGQGT
ncbi:MAG TPA: carboxylating nicotinate-nucleotide diphosphorylase [Longimicrobiales bacterium]|nr:carboxylating nicotinate-nucleotide diphosphorylase [Longimicrobiales bacterium]